MRRQVLTVRCAYSAPRTLSIVVTDRLVEARVTGGGVRAALPRSRPAMRRIVLRHARAGLAGRRGLRRLASPAAITAMMSGRGTRSPRRAAPGARCSSSRAAPGYPRGTEPDRDGRRRQHRRTADRAPECLGELGVRRRLGAAQVERPACVLVLDEMGDPADPVAQRDHREVLLLRRPAGRPGRARTGPAGPSAAGSGRPSPAPSAGCRNARPGVPRRLGSPPPKTLLTSVRRSSPRESADSGSGSEPRSPYTEIPLPARNAGFRSLAAMASARVAVLCTRLERRLSAHLWEWGLPSGRCAGEVHDDVGRLDHVGVDAPLRGVPGGLTGPGRLYGGSARSPGGRGPRAPASGASRGSPRRPR